MPTFPKMWYAPPMDCPTCTRSLLNVKPGPCPACGAMFVPSQFVFAPGSVRFCCPYCDQAYAGTGARGELVPRRFNCLRCARAIDMDEMVVRPAEQALAVGAAGLPLVSPPITAGTISLAPRPVAWPTVIGIIAIVFGTGGALGGLSGIFTPFLLGMFKGIQVPGGPDMFARIGRWAPWIAILNAFGALIAGALLASGIGLLKRRAWSRKLCVSWAIVKILFAIPMVAVTAAMQHDQMVGMFASIGKSGTPPPPGLVGAMTTGMIVFTLVFALAWAWALPVFMLVWLSRRPHRELMATWGDSQV